MTAQRLFVLTFVALLGCAAGDNPQVGEEPSLDSTSSTVLVTEVGTAPGSEFTFVADAVATEAGDIFVLDGVGRQIVVFDRAGAVTGVIGRAGEGPGELEAPVAMSLAADRLLVWDGALWRGTEYAFDGAVLRTHAVPARRESGWQPSVANLDGRRWLFPDQEIETPSGPGVQLKAGIIRGPRSS